MSALGRAPGVIIRQACRAKRVELLPSRERATPAAVAAMELALIGGSRWPSRRRRARATAAGAAARLVCVRCSGLLIHLEGRLSHRAANVAWRCAACGNIVATGRSINRIASFVRQ